MAKALKVTKTRKPVPLDHTTKSRPKMPINPPTKVPTPFQARVYALLLCIPPGQLTTYGALSKALDSSPRAVGGALRCNPYAPSVPCHRVIASDGFVGGFKGDWEKAPSGINQTLKLKLLRDEGVDFTSDGKLLVKNGIWFDGPWDISNTRKVVDHKMAGGG